MLSRFWGPGILAISARGAGHGWPGAMRPGGFCVRNKSNHTPGMRSYRFSPQQTPRASGEHSSTALGKTLKSVIQATSGTSQTNIG